MLRKTNPGLFFDAPADQGGGNPQAVTEPADAPGGGQVSDKQDKPTPQATQPAQAQTEERKFSQADVDRIVKERLDREKSKADTAAQKAAKDAETKALAEQGEWKKLAEQRAAELADLTGKLKEQDALEADIKRLTKALSEQLAAQTKDLPDYLRELLASKDPVEQMAWLTANRDKLTPKATPAANINGTARGNGQGKLSDQEANELAAIYGVNAKYLPK